MRHWLARFVFVTLCGAVATVLGTTAALTISSPGRALLARLFSQESNRLVRGSVRISAISGNFLSHLELDSVVVRDTAGAVLARIPRLEVGFSLARLLTGRVILTRLHAIAPEIQIIKHRLGRLNFQEIFRLGESAGNGPGTMVVFRDVMIERGRVVIRTPWDYSTELRSPASRDSALTNDRASPGKRIERGSEGLEQIRQIDSLTAHFALMRVSTPDHLPLSVDIDSLRADVSDPPVHVRRLEGTVLTGGDSLLFSLKRAELPRTLASGKGRVTWPRDTVLYDFRMNVPQASLVDLRWITPKFPDFTGRGRVIARSENGTRTNFDLRDLHLGDSRSHLDGALIAISDRRRGLGFKNLSLALQTLDLDAVRPFLDTLPLAGQISGTLRAEGFNDGMEVNLGWDFDDARVAGGARSHLELDGRVILSGPQGFVFQRAQLTNTNLDLRTVRLIVPSVILHGRMGLNGTLEGPWHNVVFAGTASHRDGGLPTSEVNGVVHLDSRLAILGLNLDLTVDSLAFDGLRPSFPTLTAQGALRGTLRLDGTLEQATVDADLRGELGHVSVRGGMGLQGPNWGAEALRLEFDSLDLSALRGAGPHTALRGSVVATGQLDSLAAPHGELDFALHDGFIREFRFDSLNGRLRVRDSLLTVDTVAMHWAHGTASASGTLGWVAPHQGLLRVRATATSLQAFDSVAHALTGIPVDTSAHQPLDGAVEAKIDLSGSLDSLASVDTVVATNVRWETYSSPSIVGALRWGGGRPAAMMASIEADTLAIGGLLLTGLSAHGQGSSDSLHVEGRAQGGTASRVQGAATLVRGPAGQSLTLEGLQVVLPRHTWSLERPARLIQHDSTVQIRALTFSTGDGAGSIEVTGSVGRGAAGGAGAGEADSLTIHALGVDLQDLYGLLQQDTAGVAGAAALDLRLTGTRAMPVIRGSGSITGPVFGDFRGPLVRAAFNYADSTLDANLSLWRTGRASLEIEVRLPLDLALRSVDRRQLPGNLQVRARADSVDLAVLEAYTPNIRRVSGSFSADARVEGTWASPQLDGFIALDNGYVNVPALGVRYGPIYGRIGMRGDSLRVDSLVIKAGEGSMRVEGGVRMARLTTPVLGLELKPSNFLVVNVREFLTLQASGSLQLTGTTLHPVLRGHGTANNTVVYFADLITKNIVNLEDPANADLVDTLELRHQGLGAAFQSRFLDSLAIQNLDLRVGNEVWLRSNEANIQLEGSIIVNKQHRAYRLDGTLNTPRGIYTLKIGPLSRAFSVERGTVRYFGTPDLNADLDIQARHVVQTADRTEEGFPVIAKLTGTLLVPKLSLESGPPNPPMSERDLISLLIVGRTSGNLLSSGNDAPLQAGLAYLSGALSSELQRTLITDLGVPVDLIEIRSPFSTSGVLSASTGLTQLAAGWRIGSKWFVTVNAGFCPAIGQIDARNFGASLEYRLSRDWRLQANAEPIQSCDAARPADALAALRRYQFGADIRWEREY